MRFMSTLCALALMTPLAAGSQQIATTETFVVDAGSRVRIAAPVFGNKKQVGTVVSVTRDSLVLRRGASLATQSVATSEITGLEVSKGTHTRKAKGALWGLLIGAGTGAVLGYTLYKEPKCSDPQAWCLNIIGPNSPGDNAIVSGVVGGLVGTLIGTIVGSSARDTWAPASLGAK